MISLFLIKEHWMRRFGYAVCLVAIPIAAIAGWSLPNYRLTVSHLFTSRGDEFFLISRRWYASSRLVRGIVGQVNSAAGSKGTDDAGVQSNRSESRGILTHGCVEFSLFAHRSGRHSPEADVVGLMDVSFKGARLDESRCYVAGASNRPS